jgi:hypothetical protein
MIGYMTWRIVLKTNIRGLVWAKCRRLHIPDEPKIVTGRWLNYRYQASNSKTAMKHLRKNSGRQFVSLTILKLSLGIDIGSSV